MEPTVAGHQHALEHITFTTPLSKSTAGYDTLPRTATSYLQWKLINIRVQVGSTENRLAVQLYHIQFNIPHVTADAGNYLIHLSNITDFEENETQANRPPNFLRLSSYDLFLIQSLAMKNPVC